MTLPVAVFASGSGSNLQALLDFEGESSAYRVDLVVSDRSGAGALERARAAKRDARVISVSDRSGDEIAREALEVLGEKAIEAVFLAGYLRLVPRLLIQSYRKRILNIHPALLPAFGGKGMFGIRIHEAVLRAGIRVTGVTVHQVDETYDTGSILAQWPVPVKPGDTAEALAARVLEVEHILYPLVAHHFCHGLSEGTRGTDRTEQRGAHERELRFDFSGNVFIASELDPPESLSSEIAAAFTSPRLRDPTKPDPADLDPTKPDPTKPDPTESE